MALTSQALLADLDARLPQSAESWRSGALRQIVDLFLASAPSCSGEQVALFGEVIDRLMQKMGRDHLAEASTRLAPVENAPAKPLGRLACHADIAVSGPIFDQAKALPDDVLVKTVGAERPNPALVTRIAQRSHLSAAVTDALLERGDKAIQHTLIANPNACISESGYARIICGLNGDKALAAAVAARSDVPAELRVWLDSALGN